MKMGIGGLSALSADWAARFVSRIWFTPPSRALASSEREVLARGVALDVRASGRRIATWSFGDGAPVVLVHGWGGRAGQLTPFVDELVRAKKRAIVFDGWSHGESDAGPLGPRQGSFVEVAECLAAVVEHVGEPHAVIAHSGGAVATGIALSRGAWRPKKLALVAPMARPLGYAARFDHEMGISPEVGRLWRALSERRARFAWEALDLTTAKTRFALPEALIVHDRNDKEVPFAEGEAIRDAWGMGIDLVETHGLGHQRVLRDPAVVRTIVDFVR